MTKDKNTKPIRVHPEFEKLANKVIIENLKRGTKISPSRVSLAISRQYKRYPQFLKELESADLK